jgi:hypothetical protein
MNTDITDAPDDVDFWQTLADFAYSLDGESAPNRRQAIEHFLAHSPTPDPTGPIENYRRYAALRILKVCQYGLAS